MDNQIIVVLGKVCSGKDTFAGNHLNHIHIDIGSIVRELVVKTERTFDTTLDQAIIKYIEDRFTNNLYANFIITGVRQLTILDWIITHTRPQKLQLIYLDVSDIELKRRYITRSADKDSGLSFEETLDRDNKLGFIEIEQFKNNNKSLFKIIKND